MLWVENRGNTLTFQSGIGQSVKDVTFTHLSGSWRTNGWWVRPDIFTNSDHMYVIYTVTDGSGPLPNPWVER